MGDIGSVDRWIPGVTAVTVDGLARVCSFEDGHTQDEQILDYSTETRSYRYVIEAAPLPVADNTGSFKITAAVIGERWHVGTTMLEVSEPRLPCWRLNLRMGDPRFIQRFVAAGRPGSYLRIIEEGDIGTGDLIEVLTVPDHGLTVGDVAHIFHHDGPAAGRLLVVDGLSDAWKAWAQRTLDRRQSPNDA